MKLRVLALDVDCDGIIADDGRLDPDLAAAIRDVRSAGVLTVLVSGRLLADIHALLLPPVLFDAIVAESGAVVQLARGESPTVLARGPDAALTAELERRQVANRRGLCVLEADTLAAPSVLASLRAVGSAHAIAYARGNLLVLPPGVSKASGLGEVVWRLGASLHNTVAIGGADDDQPMLDACEIGAAVAWGSVALQRSADHVIAGSGPADIAAYIRTLAAADTIIPRRKPASPLRIRLGKRTTGEPVDLEIRGRNVLFAGDPRSGKTWLLGLVCEQLILRRYALCIVDPEGDYGCLETLPGVLVHRVHAGGDRCPDLPRMLRQPALSVVVDLSPLAADAKRAAVRSLLRDVDAIRRTSGVPHRVVLDEAHYFLHRHDDVDVFDAKLGGHYLATYRSTDLASGVLDACDLLVATRISDRRLAARLLGLTGAADPRAPWVDALATLPIGEALLVGASAEEDDGILRFRFEQRMTVHVRHREKYLDVGVPLGREFVFTRGGRSTDRRVRTLRGMLEALPGVPDDVFAGHLARGDFHRWVEDVVGDGSLAAAIQGIETSDGATAREAIVRVIRDRYLDGEADPCGGERAAPRPWVATRTETSCP